MCGIINADLLLRKFIQEQTALTIEQSRIAFELAIIYIHIYMYIYAIYSFR